MMRDLFFVKARDVYRDGVREADFQECCHLVSDREELARLLKNLKKKTQSGSPCRYVVETV